MIHFDRSSVSHCSHAAGALFDWLEAFVQLHSLEKDIAPLQSIIARNEKESEILKERLLEVSQDIDNLKASCEQLQKEYEGVADEICIFQLRQKDLKTHLEILQLLSKILEIEHSKWCQQSLNWNSSMNRWESFLIHHVYRTICAGHLAEESRQKSFTPTFLQSSGSCWPIFLDIKHLLPEEFEDWDVPFLRFEFENRLMILTCQSQGRIPVIVDPFHFGLTEISKISGNEVLFFSCQTNTLADVLTQITQAPCVLLFDDFDVETSFANDLLSFLHESEENMVTHCPQIILRTQLVSAIDQILASDISGKLAIINYSLTQNSVLKVCKEKLISVFGEDLQISMEKSYSDMKSIAQKNFCLEEKVLIRVGESDIFTKEGQSNLCEFMNLVSEERQMLNDANERTVAELQKLQNREKHFSLVAKRISFIWKLLNVISRLDPIYTISDELFFRELDESLRYHTSLDNVCQVVKTFYNRLSEILPLTGFYSSLFHTFCDCLDSVTSQESCTFAFVVESIKSDRKLCERQLKIPFLEKLLRAMSRTVIILLHQCRSDSGWTKLFPGKTVITPKLHDSVLRLFARNIDPETILAIENIQLYPQWMKEIAVSGFKTRKSELNPLILTCPYPIPDNVSPDLIRACQVILLDKPATLSQSMQELEEQGHTCKYANYLHSVLLVETIPVRMTDFEFLERYVQTFLRQEVKDWDSFRLHIEQQVYPHIRSNALREVLIKLVCQETFEELCSLNFDKTWTLSYSQDFDELVSQLCDTSSQIGSS